MDGADSAKEYEYDANGNVTKDLNRNILSIQYNSLNLPSMIKFADGKTIKYTYSADGRKLRVVYTTVTPATSKQVDYCGNLIFENGQLKQMLVDGGYIIERDREGYIIGELKMTPEEAVAYLDSQYKNGAIGEISYTSATNSSGGFIGICSLESDEFTASASDDDEMLAMKKAAYIMVKHLLGYRVEE